LGSSGNAGTSPDIWAYTTAIAGNVITVVVVSRDGDVAYNANGTWTLPAE
jgi:hypothetical protein